MKATLRERPHRVLLGEMRDPEAASVFVDEVMAGHPGSMSTIHGRNPAEAARRCYGVLVGDGVVDPAATTAARGRSVVLNPVGHADALA